MTDRTVSQQCWIQAISTGETLHPSLIPTAPLSQTYSSSKAVYLPDWRVAANRPAIYLSQLNGSVQQQPTGEYTWLYNDTPLVFSGNNCTNFTWLDDSGKTQPLFVKGTRQVGGVAMPCLTISGNLVSPQNVDLDTIGYEGKAEMAGALMDVKLQIPVRLAEWSGEGYLGQITFQDVTAPASPVDGVTAITRSGQKLRATGHLYNQEQELGSGQFYCRWFLNGTEVGTNGYVDISEGDVTDHAVVECRFFEDSARTRQLTVATEGLDDLQDPEFLYVQHRIYGYDQDTSASKWKGWVSAKNSQIRKDEKVQYRFWMGRVDDPGIDAAWTKFQVQFRGKNGAVLTPTAISALSGLAVTDGWYTLGKTGSYWQTGDILYSEIVAQGLGASLYIKAS